MIWLRQSALQPPPPPSVEIVCLPVILNAFFLSHTHTHTYTHPHACARTHIHTDPLITHSLPPLSLFLFAVKVSFSVFPSLLSCLDIKQTGNQQTSWLVCWLVACLTSQQNASVSQGRIHSDFTCCYTEIEIADQTLYLTQSQSTDTRPTSPALTL